MSYVWLNGAIVPATEAKISAFDRGFLFADGIYEVVPIYSGQPFLFDAHMERLERSLREVGIPQSVSRAHWLEIIAQLHAHAPLEHAVLYIHITRGAEFPRNHLPSPNLQPTVMATLSAFTPPVGSIAPARATLMEDIRWLRCDIKSISLLGNIMAKMAAQQDGSIEPLLHRAGRVTEGASSNYFIVKDGVLITAPADTLILPGITRDWVLKLAKENGISVEERPFSVAELYAADECFLTSSTREIVPIGTVSGQLINDGQCGPVTEKLMTCFRNSRPKAVKKVKHENQI